MIIKNNFNEKSANPLKDYESIGKTHGLESEIEKEKHGFIKANLENNVLQDLRGENNDDDDSDDGDPWKFFR